MRLTTKTFVDWLQARVNETPGPSFPIWSGRQEDMPSRSAMIFKMGPGRDFLDGTFEDITFRVQSRGREESLDDAEEVALYIDGIIDDQRNLMVGDIYVTNIWCILKPYQMPMVDRDERYQFMADYVLRASKFNEEA